MELIPVKRLEYDGWHSQALLHMVYKYVAFRVRQHRQGTFRQSLANLKVELEISIQSDCLQVPGPLPSPSQSSAPLSAVTKVTARAVTEYPQSSVVNEV
jgi:hypothetical protein